MGVVNPFASWDPYSIKIGEDTTTAKSANQNESIYYNVDEIHSAIAENRQIRFRYYQWNVEKEMELRHGEAYYQVSPWALSRDDENYDLVAYDSAEEKMNLISLMSIYCLMESQIIRGTNWRWPVWIRLNWNGWMKTNAGKLLRMSD